jgi:hypothetical protein
MQRELELVEYVQVIVDKDEYERKLTLLVKALLELETMKVVSDTKIDSIIEREAA